MTITYQNINHVENPTMDMLDEPTYIARAEAIIAEGYDVATAIENAVYDEHYDYEYAKTQINKGNYEVDGIFVTDEDGEIYVDVDADVYTVDHCEELEDIVRTAYYADMVERAHERWEYSIGK